MTFVLIAFLATAGLVWLSVFGYLAAVGLVALARRVAAPEAAAYPEIAVVVPTRDEEHLIAGKLADLRRSDYPRERMTVVVADGGSTDRTAELVEAEMARDDRLRLVRLPDARGQVEQVKRVLWQLAESVVVLSDADSRLEPSCIRRLVSVLVHDPATALVGAAVRPASDLLEERIHWWFLNHLWWMEGEALSSAVVSGVCYAGVRETLLRLIDDGRAADVHLALSAGARGLRVRTCPTAHAVEVRVPQSWRELVRFRRRRGADYLVELLRVGRGGRGGFGWQVASRVRLWHLRVTPKLAVALVLAAAALLATPHWRWPLVAGGAFALPALGAVLCSTTLVRRRGEWWRLPFAGGRLAGLLLMSMLALDRPATEIAHGEPS